MNEPTKTDFQPHWYRNATPEMKDALAEFPSTGSIPLDWPRIVTRILPSSGLSSLAAHTVADVIDLTQKLAHYAAFHEIRGPNPDFADIRSMGADVLAFSKLTIEPFEDGSFVIPARFESPDFVQSDIEETKVSAEQVANRFGAILDDISTGNATSSISTGALQTVQQLNRALKKEASAIEFATFDSFERRSSFRTVDNAFMAHVEVVMNNRQPSTHKLDSLEGVVTALDIDQGELMLTIDGQNQRVKGRFYVMLHPTLLESLGQRIKLFGRVSYKKDQVAAVYIQQAEVLDSE